jgi:peptidoglycan-N-acetylglucosamine deacetylase
MRFMKYLAVIFLVIGLTIIPRGDPAGRSNAAENAADAAHQMFFGSKTILEKCWTKEELKGTKAEKAVKKGARGEPDVSNPHPTTSTIFQSLPPGLRNSIRSVHPDGDQRIVALTFDLCEAENETAGYDGEIIDYLRAHQIKATLFAGGKWMRSHPKRTMQLMADPLFEIGNHSWSHLNARKINAEAFRAQILRTQKEYVDIFEALKKMPCAAESGTAEIGKISDSPRLFRFPYGACNADSLRVTAELGMPAIQWSIVTADPVPGQKPEAMAAHVLKSVAPGSIIIAHANGRGHGTAQALPIFVPKLVAEGYSFLTVSELLMRGSIQNEDECFENHRGDNYRYDRKGR